VFFHASSSERTPRRGCTYIGSLLLPHVEQHQHTPKKEGHITALCC
jgi:hypothetical protein